MSSMGDRYSQVPPSRTNERGSAHHHQQHPSQRQRFPEDTPNFNERPVKSVPPPAVNKPTDAEFFLQDEHGEMKPNHAFLKEHFFREGRLQEEHALYILEQTTKILSKEPNMVHVRSPVTVCGDIHGQYYDLMKLFEVGGPMADNTYLFLGDYVDRGDFGIECLLYLYALKIWNPTGIILLRGNHECRHLTEYFTFKRECLHKYSERVYEACIVSFCALPITALIDNRFFCVHGGISPQLVHLSDVDAINRFQEPGSHGLLCDLLWSDPVSNYGHEHEPTAHGPGLAPGQAFLHNQTRGCSFFFTYEAVCAFLERNNLLTVIRGHEAQDAGYTMHRKTPKKNFPSVITIFSAPNYLDVYHNRGAVLKYANKNITIRQYNSSTHPYWLPNFMDAFTWSLPFVGSKITEMLLAILSICSDDELVESESDEDAAARGAGELPQSPTDLAQRRQLIKNKIMAVGKMQRVFQILREEAENATELDSPTEGGFSQRGPDALTVQGHKIGKSIRTFDDARRSDIANERLPDFDPQRPTIFPVPSMRLSSRTDLPDGMDMEYLIKRTLDEDEAEATGMSTSTVERLADRIAQGRKPTGRPGALKRHETVI